MMASRLAPVVRDPALRTQLSIYLLSRLPAGMFGLAVIVHVRDSQGSVASAGVVVASYTIAVAVTAPLTGRLVDRLGARWVLPVTALLYLGGALATAVASKLPEMCLGAAVAGLTLPPTPAVIRAAWRELPEVTRTVVFSVDGVILEGAQVIGPLLIGAVLLVSSSSVALAASAGVTALAALLAAAGAGSHVYVPHRRRLLGPLRVPAVDLLLLTLALVTAAIAVVEISVVEFAAEHHHPALAGPLYSAMAVGSMLGGLVFAAREHRSDARRLLVPMCGAAAAGFALLLITGTATWWLAVVLAVSNAAVAPVFALIFANLSDVTPPGEGAETFTWASSSNFVAISAGTALGAALLGQVPRQVVYLVSVAILVAAAAVAAVARGLTSRSVNEPASDLANERASTPTNEPTNAPDGPTDETPHGVPVAPHAEQT